MDSIATAPTILPFSPAPPRGYKGRVEPKGVDQGTTSFASSNRIFQSVWENSPDGMRLTDESGRIVAVNPAYCVLVGKPAEELVGCHFSAVYAPSEDLPKLSQDHCRRFVSGTIIARADRSRVLWNGTRIEYEVVRTFVNTDEGKLLLLTEFRDIQEKKRIEKSLRESEANYRGLFANAIQPMFQSTVEGGLINANGAMIRLLGYSSFAELAALDLARDVYVDPAERGQLKEILQAKGYVKNVEIHLKRKNGKVITVLEHARTLRDAQGRVVAFEGILEDISAQKLMEEKVRQYVEALEFSKKTLSELNAQKDKLFSILAHDLRSPFNSILGFCDLLLHESLNEEERAQYVGYIRDSAADQLALVNKLLDWARLESGKVSIARDDVDVSDVVDHAIRCVEGIARQKGVELQNKLLKGVGVRGDFALLQQVFGNLLGNALKFTPRGGLVSVDLFFSTDERWTVAVHDTGVGIPAKDIGRLFKVEEKYTRTGLQGEHGTGLGLPLCYEIVQQHGGAVRVMSDEGRGTTFLLTFPKNHVKADHRVLVVDDEKVTRKTHARYVTKSCSDVEVFEASTEDEALTIAHEKRPQVIICDADDGCDASCHLAERLREDPLTTSIPLILVADEDWERGYERTCRQEAAAILMKPIEQQQIANVLAGIFGRTS